MKLYFAFCSVLFLAISGFAQDQKFVDSLQTALQNHYKAKEALHIVGPSMYDTTAIKILDDLSYSYWGSNRDKALDYANQFLKLSEQINYKKGIGNAYSGIGTINNDNGDYSTAIEFHKKALQIRLELGDKGNISGTYNNLAIAYGSQGNYNEAYKNHFASLKMSEEIGDSVNVAMSCNNIGLIYMHQDNYTKALEYQLKALKIQEELGYKYGAAVSYSNIGIIYMKQGKYEEALKNQFSSLKLSQEIGYFNIVSNAYLNIGLIYYSQNKDAEALKYYFDALKLNEQYGNKGWISTNLTNIGLIYSRQKKYALATEFLNRGLAAAKEIGSLKNMRSSYQALAGLDSMQGNFNKAFEHFKLYIDYRDSISNTENEKKTIALQMQYDFDKKESAIQAEQEKKNAIAAEEMQKQKVLRNTFFGGFSVVLLFSLVFLRQRNRIAKQRNSIQIEKNRSEELLLNILPEEVAEELKEKGSAEAQLIDEVTVLFTDFKGFTQLSEKLTAKELVNEINECFSAFDHIMTKHGVEKIKTIGDAYMAAGGLPTPNATHATDVVKAALDIQQFMQEHRRTKEAANELFFEIRIGVHTGPVVAGIVGVKKFAYDIWGDTVNTASRMESSGEAGKVNISGTTYAYVKEKFECTSRGKIQAKGKGEVEMYFVENSKL